MKNLTKILFLISVSAAMVMGQEEQTPTPKDTVSPQPAPVPVGMEKKPEKGINYSTIAFGPVLMLNYGDGGMAYDLSLGQQWKINPVTALKFRMDGAADFKAKAYMADGGIGLNYYLPVKDFTPYMGGDFGFGGAIDHDSARVNPNGGDRALDYTLGFVISLNLGIALYRSSAIYLSLEPTWQIILSDTFPIIYGIKFGINR